MNQKFPSWMFAAFAIGVWELCDQVARVWHLPNVRWAGGVIAAALVCVIGIRYVVRYLHRDKNARPPDEDDWKNY